MYNVFQSWSFMERRQHRSVCFKSKSSGSVPETQAELDHAKVSAEQWNDYQRRFVPFENKYIADVTGGNTIVGADGKPVWVDNGATGFKQDVVGGRVNTDLARQNNGAIPVGGMNRIGSTIAGNMMPTAAASGAAALSTAKGKVRDTQIEGMLSAVNVGRGQAASAINSMGSIASNAADEAQTAAESSWNRQSATQSAIMSGVGATAAATGEYLKPSK